jgi:hypothetical protein
MKTNKCSCGEPKPCRRAVACSGCWDKVPAGERRQLEKTRDSLRLSFDKPGKK